MPPVRLTDRDVEILRWLADFRTGATVRQVTRRFAMEASRARRRLAQLRAAGYLAHERVFWAQPGPYQVTPAGMAVVGVDRPAPEIDVRVYRHDLAVVDLAIDFELGGETVVTALAAEALEPPARYSVVLAGERRFPDLVLERDDERRGVELLAAGDGPLPGGLEGLVAAYGEADHLAGAIVFVETPATRAELEAIAADLLAAERLDVRTWTPRDDG
jgi:Replication-relaxation